MSRERAALRAAACCGAASALATLALLIAALGFLGWRVGAQSLLANLQVHAAAAALGLWGVVALGGWRWAGLLGAVIATGMIGWSVASVRWAPVKPAPAATVRVDLLLFNVFYANPNGAAIAAWLETSGLDAAVLLEAAPLAPHRERLRAAFPHQFGCDVEPCEMLALSRWPIESAAWVGAPHAPQRLARLALATPDGTVTLFATHWERDFFSRNRLVEATYLARAIRAHVRDVGGAFALVGDFNATPWDFHFDKVRREFGLRLAARWTPTWPVGGGPFGAPIDHVVAPPGAFFERFERLESDFGSNHHGLRARLAFEPRAD